jgi:DoxX-like family
VNRGVPSDRGLGTHAPQDRGRKYRARIVIYWIVTLLVAQENVAGSIWAYLRLEFITANLKHLGYPSYFLNIIGFWQLLCAVAILVPRFGRVKEWAYAGAFFNYSSAVYSHVM